MDIVTQTEVYTTGAFLSPIRVESEKGPRWMWVVTQFEDDTFLDGSEVEVMEYNHKLRLDQCMSIRK